VLFSRGRPLSSDAWQLELKLFADAGYRAIAGCVGEGRGDPLDRGRVEAVEEPMANAQ
jgi:hypothetical protein